MATVPPFYSESGTVYHTCSNCSLGNNIDSGNKKQGTGGKPKCEQCKDKERSGTC